jgi:hypothetical protein
LEGKIIFIGKISKLDTPLEYFSDGSIVHPHDTSLLVWGEFFLHLLEIKNVIAPLVLSSLRTLKDHLLWLREFA